MGRNWAIHLTLYDMSWRLEVYFLWLIPFIGIWILQQLVNMFICADGISSWGAMNQFDLLCRTLVCRFAPHSDWSPYHCCFQQISTHGALQLISWGHFLSSAKFKFVVYCETHYLDFRTITMKISVCLHSPLKKMSFFATIASIRKHCQRHNGPEDWVLLTKVTSLGHITSSNTNLNQTSSESRPCINFKISTKHHHFDKT